jgi:HAD superfamily hydrolase (TIGR01509 family)
LGLLQLGAIKHAGGGVKSGYQKGPGRIDEIIGAARKTVLNENTAMIKALLWDNDGVLIDTEGLFFQATRDVLMVAGIELSRGLYVEYALQQGRSCFDLAADRGCTASQISELRAQRDRVYSAMLADGPGPMKHVRDTLTLLRERFRMAVVTTSKAEHFHLMHRRWGLLEFFDFAITREDYEHSKPSPEPYIAALNRLRLTAKECVAIEDSDVVWLRRTLPACAAS